jgi:hypothetical protein
MTTNKEVAEILSSTAQDSSQQQNKAHFNSANQLNEAKWGDEGDIDIEDEMMHDTM